MIQSAVTTTVVVVIRNNKISSNSYDLHTSSQNDLLLSILLILCNRSVDTKLYVTSHGTFLESSLLLT